MAGAFDFLAGIPGNVGDFISEDPDRFSILAGNLGKAIGTGNPIVEQLGTFGAGLGYTGKLDKEAQSQQDMWKTLLGLISGPQQPGITGIKHTGKGITLDVTPGELANTSLDAGGNPISTQSAQPSSGGGGATAPFTQAPTQTNSSGDISDLLSALAGATASPKPSLRWLTPEMAIQVMGQRQNQQQLANTLTTALRGQDITRANAITASEGKGQRIPVRINPKTGEMTPDPNSSVTVTPAEFSSRQSDISQYRTTREAQQQEQLRDQAARFLGASDFQGLAPNAQSIAVEMTKKAQNYWQDRAKYKYDTFDDALTDAFYEVKGASDVLTQIPTAKLKTDWNPLDNKKPGLTDSSMNSTINSVVLAYEKGASAEMILEALIRNGYTDYYKDIMAQVKKRIEGK